MEVHTLEIDSSERDYSKYPDPHDYVIDLKNEIYDIQKITLLSARIPNSQTLINAHNNTFSVNNFQGNVADSLTLDGSGITTPSTLVSTLANSFSGMDVVVELNKGALLLKNDSLTLTKNIDFTGTVSSNIGIPSELIQIVPGANYRGQSVIFGSITSMSFDIEYTNIQRSVEFPSGSYGDRNLLADTLSQYLGSDLNVVYDGFLKIINTSTYTYAITFPSNQIGIETTTITITPGSTYTAGAFTNTVPAIGSIDFQGGYYTSTTKLVDDLNLAFGSDINVTITSGKLVFTNMSVSNYQISDMNGILGVTETPLILPGESYTGDAVTLNPVTAMTVSITVSNATASVTFPGGTFKTGGDLAVAFSLLTGLRTMYIENRLRVFNTSLFDITLKLTGTTASQIGLNEGDISIMKSTYHQGATSLFGIIPDLAFELRNVETSIINLYNRSFTNGDDLASNISDHITQVTVSFDSDTNALTWLNNDPNKTKVLKFGDGVNARYGLGTDDTVSNLITSQNTTPHQVFGNPPQNITISGGGTYTGGSINLEGPNALLIRIGSGSETFNKDVYVREPFYTGQILLNGDYVNYTSSEDPVEHTFFSGSHKNLKKLHISFFTMSLGRLIPYEFRNQEHVLKFKIECNTGKFKAISKHTAPDVGVLPPPISIPELEDPYRWNQQYILIAVITFLGILTLIITRKRT